MSDLDLERIKAWRAAVREHRAKPLPRGPGSHYTTSPEGELRCSECEQMCGGAYVHPCDCCATPNRPDLYVAVDVDALVAEVERLSRQVARAGAAEAEVREGIAADIDASSCGCPCCGIAAQIAGGAQ